MSINFKKAITGTNISSVTKFVKNNPKQARVVYTAGLLGSDIAEFKFAKKSIAQSMLGTGKKLFGNIVGDIKEIFKSIF